MKKNYLYFALKNCRAAIVVAIMLAIPLILPSSGGAFQADSSAAFPVNPDNNPSSSTDQSNNPHESQHKFEKYIKNKYKQIQHAESDVKQTMHGLSGRVWLSGDIVPQKKAAIDLTKEPDRHVRARAIAKAFMEDEAVLLGITNPEEIREANIKTSEGFGGDYTHIDYRRYVNDTNLGDVLQITIGPDENIFNVQAQLVPVPPEVYEATKKKTLTEEEIRSIVEADLKENNINTHGNQIQLNKYAITDPPYVIWIASLHWRYTINAFTGEIIDKKRNIKTPKKRTSTDKDNHGDTQPPMPPPILPPK